MLTQFDEKTQKVIVIAESLAFDMGHSSVGSEHLLLSLLKIKETSFSKILSEYKVNSLMISEEIERLFGKTDNQPFYMEYSDVTRKILDDAISMTLAKKEDKVNVNTLSIALLMQNESVAVEMLKKFDVNINHVKKTLSVERSYIHELDNINELTNINEKVKIQKRLMIGREKEVTQLCLTLCKKEKNNALIIGKAGVGKTALVEKLALMINSKEVMEPLKGKLIYELNLSSLVAGTKYRGEFEEKLKKIIDKVMRIKDVVLFIDEIHNLIGAGGAEGAIDASNILKPYLARGDLSVIGATTLEEYYKYFEKDQAMNRRFSVIKVNENTKDETLVILKGIYHQYESYHHIKIDEDRLMKVIDLCDKHINQKVFPDIALDVLDLSCVKAKFLHDSELEDKHIEEVIEELSGSSIHHNIHYDVLEEKLNNDVLGQKDSIHKLILSLKSLSLFSNGHKPMGVYMFIGNSGVGKTYLAKRLAKYLGRHLVKLDMSEYNESHSVSKILGSAPGYVGYNDQSVFLKELVLYPDSIVLLDEVEKASGEVLNLFLQVFDEGVIKDNHDRSISFKDTIIIMTSNVYVQNNHVVGFKKQPLSLDKLKEYFNEEFLNRIDEVIGFEYLTYESLKGILKIHSPVDLSESDIDEILNDYSNKQGARSLIRKMKKYLVSNMKLLNK